MTAIFNYTSVARKIAYRYPRLTYFSVQLNFWIIVNLLYSAIIYLNTKLLFKEVFNDYPLQLNHVVISSIIFGVIIGLLIYVVDIILLKVNLRKLSAFLVIIIKSASYLVVVAIIIYLFKLISFISFYVEESLDLSFLYENEESWRNLYWSYLLYIAFMGAVINFINQMNLMFGPGVLIPLMMGRYQNPVEQERIFMFLDLQSSTTHAEELGHIAYSTFIRDCFNDLNEVAVKHNAGIYQYVGDEAVLTWEVTGVGNVEESIKMFFAFQKKLELNANFYRSKYNRIPLFKAGIHKGIVTAVEVGRVKREIAYHGDTINTAARIQGLCNQYNEQLLISHSIFESFKNSGFSCSELGEMELRGKEQLVKVYNVRPL